MTDAQKLKLIADLIEADANRQTQYEANPEFNPADDGNFNDAYSYGYEDGETHMARSILSIIKGLT